MKFTNSIHLALVIPLKSVPVVHAAVRLGSNQHPEVRQDEHNVVVTDPLSHSTSSGLLRAAANRRANTNTNSNGNVNTNGNNGNNQGQGKGRPFRSDCTAAVADIQGVSPEDDLKIACEDERTGVARDLDINKVWMREAISSRRLHPGDKILVGDKSMIGEDGKVHPSNANPGIERRGGKKKGGNGAGRKLASVTGDKSVLAVKVVLFDATYTKTESELSDSVFGTNGDPVNLKSQYAACSHNQLNVVQATTRTGKSTSITNGVVTIRLDGTGEATPPANLTTAHPDSIVRPAVTEELNAQFSDLGLSANQLANHVMYCLPPGTMSGIAYAFINNWNSVYSDMWCNYVSAQMHEIGHNLNLAHSNENGSYKDQTGMMGYSYSENDGPVMCFNNAKNWQLGWFSDRQQIIEKEACVEGLEIEGQARYSSSSTRPVIVKINAGSTAANPKEDYYLGFNHKAGANVGTREAANQVTIQRATIEDGSGTPGGGSAASELVAKLGNGGEWTSPDLGGGQVTVKVTGIDTSSMTGFATVDIISNLCSCASDAECDDGYTCNGAETCDLVTEKCVPGTPTGGERTIEVSVFTDNYPTETTWNVANSASDVVMSSSSYSDPDKLYTKSVEVCPADDTAGNYTFTINDTYGDGICCRYGFGSYTVKLDGTDVANGGEFTNQEIKNFPVGPAGPAPTTAPITPLPTPSPTKALVTPLPSLSPTASPSGSPTSSPTASPNESPSASPSGAPTSSPTPAPNVVPTTTSPTDSPSSFPSGAPTSSPSVSPTTSPTKSPTNSPTSSPTVSPTNAPTSPPTSSPTASPTVSPTYAPTVLPTVSPTKAPTIPTVAPTVAPTVPAPDAYYTVCGASGRCQLAKEAQQKDTLHEVRCCSETQITNWPKKSNCNVWAESDIGGTCYNGETHAGAAAICVEVGARLCTAQELLDDCTRGTGCSHDMDMIWSSDPAMPTAAPTSYPTMKPSTARPTVTMQPTQKGASGETGRVGVSHGIMTVQTRYIYQDPVVVAFINSRNEDDSVDVRVMDVTSRSFKVFLEEANGGETPFNHAEEQVSYIVMEKGRQELEGGLIVEAGSHTTTSVHNWPQQFSGDSITFTEPFTGIAMPAVLTTLNTNNNGKFMSSLATQVNLNSFQISQEALQTNSPAVAETIGWMAFLTGVGTTTNGSPYISGYAASDGTANGVAQTAYSINLGTETFTDLPDLVVGLYETTGTDGAYARGAGIFTNTQQTIYAEEDQTTDGERNHVSVPAAWVGFRHNSDLFAAAAPSASCTPAQESCESSEECCSGECLGERKCAGATTTM